MPKSDSNTTCGTCGWSEPFKSKKATKDGRYRLSCLWRFHHPTPLSMFTSTAFMYADEGQHCACWKEK